MLCTIQVSIVIFWRKPTQRQHGNDKTTTGNSQIKNHFRLMVLLFLYTMDITCAPGIETELNKRRIHVSWITSVHSPYVHTIFWQFSQM